MQLTIQDFKGVNFNAGLWNQGFATYAAGMDFYGLGDNSSLLSYEGVLQGALSLSAMPQAAATNNITNTINDIAYNPAVGSYFGIDISANGRIYKWAQATPNWILDHTAVGIGRNIAYYAGAMYYTAGTQLGQKIGSGGAYTDGWQTGLTATNPMPMKVFAGSLFVGHGNSIAKYDGTTFTLQKLILPSEFSIRSFEIFRDGLYISADSGQYSRVFIWDGTSPTFNDSILFTNEANAPTLCASGGLLWMVGNRGGDGGNSQSTSLTPVYIMQLGSLPDVLFELPLNRSSNFLPHTGVAPYQGGILIGSGEIAGNSYEDGVGGVWYIGKDLSSGLFHSSLLFPAGQSMNIGAINAGGLEQSGGTRSATYIAFKNTQASTFGVFEAASTSISPNNLFSGASEWISLPIDAGTSNKKAWTALQIYFEQIPTGTSINIFYRLDSGVNGFQTLKAFTTASDVSDYSAFLPIGRSSRTIDIKLQIIHAASTVTTRIRSFTLYYELFNS